MNDPRYNVHNVSVQSLPSSFRAPKRKLTHTTKFMESPEARRGTAHAIPFRVTIGGGLFLGIRGGDRD